MSVPERESVCVITKKENKTKRTEVREDKKKGGGESMTVEMSINT